MIRSVAPN
ncbi:hypothetical protein YPPY60_1795, partial [Yersinia pestis PY-60]